MKVTDITPQQKKTGRFNLYVDGVFTLGLGSSTIALFNLYKGKDLSDEDLDEIIKSEIYSKFYDRAFTYTTGAVKSEKTVRQYLKRVYLKKKKVWIGDNLDYDLEETISKVISKLKEYGLLNDKEYAQLFVSSRERSKPRSKTAIANELRLKGISNEDIETALESVSDDDMIYNVYVKKYGEKPFDANEQPKVVAFLARKGFSWDLISKLERRLKGDI
ncbi:MAG: recombination regulator RecX [candidate division WS6 bacterium GW2011_GWF2_39_15]|uniref:Regulatory protein RecX n=1 Tax=candidate division WS6 bacterium GW2011_GWF2_39_15 TaxID=1619100 RepID=A0A0G0MS16_9BACT|nr:MAG: recombination regulator RecX [candidate division WS6 bacterium GW2011_GWF2_39_15]